jgi:signal transduction histidine kinase
MNLYKELLQDFTQLKDFSSLGKTYYNLGNMYLKRNEMQLAMQSFNKALEIYSKHPDPIMEVETLCMQGYLYSRLMDHEKNLACCNRAMQIAEQENDLMTMGNLYSYIAAAYQTLKQTDKSKEFLHKSLKIAKKLKIDHLIALCLSNLADIQSAENKHEIAEKYVREALRLDLKTDNTNYIGQDYFILGNVLHRQERWKEAENSLNDCLKIAKQCDLNEVYICGAVVLVRNYVHQKKFSQADKLLLPLLASVGEDPVSELHLQILEVAAFLYSARGSFAKSNEYLMQYHEITEKYIVQESRNRAQYMMISLETEQKEKERQWLRRQNKLLEKRVAKEVAAQLEKDRIITEHENMAMLGRITAGIAHELNNPLAAIKQTVEITLKSIEKSKVGKLYLTEKQMDIYRMLNRINRLVEIIKVIAHSPDRFTLRPFNVNDMVVEFTELFSERILRDNVTMLTKLTDKLPEVEGDAIRFIQVISILVHNANDALCQLKGNKLRQITVSSYLNDDHVYLEVNDNGPGMTAEILEKAKLPFFSTKTVDKGMGMGLSIAASIISNMKGKLMITSKPNSGTRVTIVLPIWHNPSGELDD